MAASHPPATSPRWSPARTRELLRRDLRLKTIALLLAILLWFVYAASPLGSRDATSAPRQVPGTAPDLPR
jgi:hypothetical protein